jgi:hypothetical protein
MSALRRYCCKMTDQPRLLKRDHMAAVDVKRFLLDAVFE